MKNPLTPAGIDPATFRFVAQHLNHCATETDVLREKPVPVTLSPPQITYGHKRDRTRACVVTDRRLIA